MSNEIKNTDIKTGKMLLDEPVIAGILVMTVGMIVSAIWLRDFDELWNLFGNWFYVFGSWALVAGIYNTGVHLGDEFTTLNQDWNAVGFILIKLGTLLTAALLIGFFFFEKIFLDELFSVKGFMKMLIIVVAPGLVGVLKGTRKTINASKKRLAAEAAEERNNIAN